MSRPPTHDEAFPNGPAAAAILAAGVGCAMLGILAFTADASAAIGRMLNFYNPTGTLSGVTTTAILVWLGVWLALHKSWHARSVSAVWVNTAAFLLLGVGLLLTCPPIMDLLQGK
jgi:hypothetical protein